MFWNTCLAQSGDHDLRGLVAPFFAWRALVIASPACYNVADSVRLASGKTTLAYALRRTLNARGISTIVLDSDTLQHMLPNSSYAPAERDWFYNRLVEVVAWLARMARM